MYIFIAAKLYNVPWESLCVRRWNNCPESVSRALPPIVKSHVASTIGEIQGMRDFFFDGKVFPVLPALL